MAKRIILFVITILLIVFAAVYTASQGMFGIFIPLTLLFPVAIIVFVFSIIHMGRQKVEKLLKSGKAAKAKILSVRDTGVSINYSPRIEIQLEVTPDDGTPFNTSFYTVVSRLNPQLYQPGMIVLVRYDPNNIKSVAIESVLENTLQNNSLGGALNKNTADVKPLLCPSCGGQIKIDNSLLNEKVITCSYCATVIDLHY